MDIQSIIALIDAVSKAEIMNLEIEEGNFRLSVDKLKQRKEIMSSAAPSAADMPMQLAAAPSQAAGSAAVQTAAVQALPAVGAAPLLAANITEIKSPIVGTYYSASGADSADFVKIGDKVSKGQTLCIIEAMKLMNDIECEYEGEVLEILVKNEQMVEFGQVLFRIKTA